MTTIGIGISPSLGLGGCSLTGIGHSYFVTTWQTENAGSATKTIVIPTTSVGYACYVSWGDGSVEEYFSGTAPSISHVYSTTGVKTIKIRGTFPRIYFNNTGDKLKLLTIENWGAITWSSMYLAFTGCANLTGNYTDYPLTNSVTVFDSMFDGCALFNSPVLFDTSNGIFMGYMFRNCSVFNQSLSGFNTAKVTEMVSMFNGCIAFNQTVVNFNTALVTKMNNMFYGCTNFNQSLASFNTIKVTTMVGMLRGCTSFKQSLATFNLAAITDMTNMLYQTVNINDTGTSTNYDATLVGWDVAGTPNTITFHGGSSKYGAGAGAAARAHLVLAVGSGGHGWTITTDGGPI